MEERIWMQMGAGSQDQQAGGDSSRSFEGAHRASFGSSRSMAADAHQSFSRRHAAHIPSFCSSFSADTQESCSYTPPPSFGLSAHPVDAAASAGTPPASADKTPLHQYSPSPWHPLQAASDTGFATAQSLHAAVAQAASSTPKSHELDGRSVLVENLHVHFHNQYAVGGIREEYERRLGLNSPINCPRSAATASASAGVANQHPSYGTRTHGSCEPSFALASFAEGINFGRKFAKRLYRAVKHVDERRNLITYTQSPSAMQTIVLALTLGLSTKRSKHGIVLFDSGPPQHLAHAWPLHIQLCEITSLIRSLGASFEYTRTKVRKNQFSLYIFGIKQRGTRFSSQGMQTWSTITSWAQNLPDAFNNASVSLILSSLQSFEEESF